MDSDIFDRLSLSSIQSKQGFPAIFSNHYCESGQAPMAITSPIDGQLMADTVEKLTLRAALPFQLKSLFCYFSYLASKLWLNTVEGEWFKVFYAI